MLYLSRSDVAGLLTHEDCIAACEEALALQARNEAIDVPRIQFQLEKGFLRFMPAMIKAKGIAGQRVYGGSPVRLMYMLWDTRDGTPLAMMDAQLIRDIRTGAIGAVGAKYLSRPESTRIAVLGSGNQARSGLIAHTKIRQLTHCTVFSPTKEHREAFAREMGAQLGLDIEPVDSPEAALREADIVITGSGITKAPVLRGAWLQPGMHISGIGSKSELDDEVVVRASRIVIDSKAQFPHECTDITAQVEKGLITWEEIAELHEVVGGLRPGRESPDEITLLKTTGTPLQDLLPAATAYWRAVEKGIGQDLGDLFPPALGWYARAGAGV